MRPRPLRSHVRACLAPQHCMPPHPLHACVVHRAARRAHRPAGWQNKTTIDRIHVCDILDVVTENDASGGDGLELPRPACAGASMIGAD